MSTDGSHPGGPARDQEKSGSSSSHSQDAVQALQSDADAEADTGDTTQKNTKSLAFHLSFIGIALVSFLFSLDATTQAVALPVSCSGPETATSLIIASPG